jgi:hypothetical protein
MLPLSNSRWPTTAPQTTKVSFCRQRRGGSRKKREGSRKRREGSRKKREGSTLKMKEDARKRDGSWPNHAGTRLKSAPVGQLSWNSYTIATTFSPDH